MATVFRMGGHRLRVRPGQGGDRHKIAVRPGQAGIDRVDRQVSAGNASSVDSGAVAAGNRPDLPGTGVTLGAMAPRALLDRRLVGDRSVVASPPLEALP